MPGQTDQTEQVPRLGSARRRSVQGVIGFLIVIVVGSAALRLSIDVPALRDGTVPEEDYDRRFVEHPWLAYLHLAPGIVYLVLAPLQLAYRVRSRHYTFHRRLGRVLLSLALLSGVYALVFGGLHSFGSWVEAAATFVFGAWFLVCLLLAFAAIRRDDVVNHRRWMIRAFAIAVGVGTVRIWVGLFQATGLLGFRDSFDVAFWLSFSMHALVAEWWVRTTPHPPG